MEAAILAFSTLRALLATLAAGCCNRCSKRRSAT